MRGPTDLTTEYWGYAIRYPRLIELIAITRNIKPPMTAMRPPTPINAMAAISCGVRISCPSAPRSAQFAIWSATCSASKTGASTVFFLVERIRFFHYVWHLFVIAGTACHFIAAPVL